MRHDEQVRQLKIILERLDSGTTVDAGGLRQNPTSVYTDPEIAAREQQQFFADHAQLAGLSGDLPVTGNW